MRTFIFSFVLLFTVSTGYSWSVICYDHPTNNSCFWSNYDCADFSGCTSPCNCTQHEILNVSDEGSTLYDTRIDAGTLQIRENGTTTWTNIYDMDANIKDDEVVEVSISCELDRVIIKVYDYNDLLGGKSSSESYLRTVNVSHANSNC